MPRKQNKEAEPQNNRKCKHCKEPGNLICIPKRVGFKFRNFYVHHHCAADFLKAKTIA